MDPQTTAALIGGILGGGVTGAIIGGLITLMVQRRALAHERSTRFIDLKRDRYAKLLRDADEWVRLLNNQRAVAGAALRGEANLDGMPTLPPTTDMWHLANEIALLDRDVGRLATSLVADVVAMGPLAVDSTQLGDVPRSTPEWAAAFTDFSDDRARFLDGAGADLIEV